ncbi:MAG: ABC transporter ATP-binding protein [Haloferacaceae archaeon]
MSDTASEEGEQGDSSAATGDISLQVENVTKIFTEDDGSEVVAVDDISLDIREGEFIVLVGPSGCGKTTTLRMIAGLEEPTEGRIIIEGRDVSGKDPRERDIAMVFQNYALYPHKTVRENMAFPLQIRKYPKGEIEDRVQDTATLLDISELLDRHPSDLSGGQQQRVALGRAIIRDPSVFLFDEPLSNLDAKLRIQMRTELNKLHERVGKTSVYVTHDQAEAMTLSDRVAVMNDGKLQQIDPPETVYAEPANRFVAGFIGEPPMNFFEVALEERGDETWVVSDTFELRLPEELVAPLASWDGDRSRVDFGIRPENLYDASLREDPVPEDRSFEAYVKVIEPMGPHKDLAVSPLHEQADEDAEFTARVSNDTDVDIGDTITLGVEMEESHLFDRRTGDNLVR